MKRLSKSLFQSIYAEFSLGYICSIKWNTYQHKVALSGSRILILKVSGNTVGVQSATAHQNKLLMVRPLLYKAKPDIQGNIDLTFLSPH